MSEFYQSLSHSKGARHIMPIFRNPSRFTIGGRTCSRRLFLYCVECIVKAAPVSSASPRADMRSPFCLDDGLCWVFGRACK
jgi:hypothetical protein